MTPLTIQPWYRALSRTQWNTLLASNLGWVFDGFEAYALILTASVALHQLLPAAKYSQIPAYAGGVIATTLCGWAIGGVLAGVLADYVGRKRTMIYAILTYSIMTGLSAFSWNWTSFAVLRFLAGLAIGSEWVTGTSMTAEFWPDEARGKGSGLFQSGFGIGFFLASVTWLIVGARGPGAWRTIYLIGVLPALLTLWIRRAIPESSLWEKANELRRAANQRKRSGSAPTSEDRALTRFTLLDLFASPAIRKRTIIAFLMATASAVGFWGISTWVPPYIGTAAAMAGHSPPQWASFTGMAYNAGSIAGYIGMGFLADAFGRRPVTLTFFAFSLLATPVLFLWTHDLRLLVMVSAIVGFFGSGQLTWLSVWLPELFPTRMRATAAGFIFNGPRLIAAGGTLMAGRLIVRFGGYGNAAMIVSTIYLLGLAAGPFLPETRGKPLPETI
ncbi:MAG TPA: MFS transporter [Candidatus Acidoferrales bacterium]|nr:MFS transporter [Candidatus Acidoferrales bacterium]